MTSVMRFDDLWLDDEDGQPSGDLPMAPDGEHAAEITDAKFDDLKFKIKPDNPRGTSLVLAVNINGFRPLEPIIPAQMRWLIESVCRSASVNPPVKGQDWDCEQLVGRQVRVKTVFGIAKSGSEYVGVDKWIPGPEPLPAAAAKPAPARTPAAKVEAVGQGGSPDDIPF